MSVDPTGPARRYESGAMMRRTYGGLAPAVRGLDLDVRKG